MKHKYFFNGVLLFIFFLILQLSCSPDSEPLNDNLYFEELLCEYEEKPLGIDNPSPRLTWKVSTKELNASQSAYQILVSDDPGNLDRDQGNLWDTGKVTSSRSVNIPYQGKPLESGKTCYWKVKIWDKNDSRSSWSHTGQWEMGLLELVR